MPIKYPEDRFSLSLVKIRDFYDFKGHLRYLEFRQSRGLGREDPELDFTVHAVFPNSLKTYRLAVERCAVHFKREFGYDFPQYEADEGRSKYKNPDVAFLWTERDSFRTLDDTVGIGACCFRWREFQGGSNRYGLAWIWFHPNFRRLGHLARAWPTFRRLFGDFAVELPISDAMMAFCEKMGEEFVEINGRQTCFLVNNRVDKQLCAYND